MSTITARAFSRLSQPATEGRVSSAEAQEEAHGAKARPAGQPAPSP